MPPYRRNELPSVGGIRFWTQQCRPSNRTLAYEQGNDLILLSLHYDFHSVLTLNHVCVLLSYLCFPAGKYPSIRVPRKIPLGVLRGLEMKP